MMIEAYTRKCLHMIEQHMCAGNEFNDYRNGMKMKIKVLS